MTDDNSHLKISNEVPELEVDPRDGLINFSQYTVSQLRELEFGIDRQRARKNYANLMAELKRRDLSSATDGEPQFPVRWTVRNGVFGWLEGISNRIPFYGSGYIQPRGEDVIVGGWRRTWLGSPIQAELVIARTSIRNVNQDELTIEFESKTPWRMSRPFRYRAASAEAAMRITALLPATNEKITAELQTYNRQLRKLGASARITPALVLANVCVFVAMAIAGGTVTGFDAGELSSWGGNIGILTVGGQWWRLLSSTFLHLNWIHLLSNMWVLWSVGRLTERQFGNLVFFSIYILAGLFAALSSIVWNPFQLTVGASGAIFGVLGAFLAYLLKRKTHVPAAIVRSYWLPTLLFVGFNLVAGVMQPNIDNAAHVGGLLTGFALGWIMAQPLDKVGYSALRLITAGALVTVCAISTLCYLGVPGRQPTLVERYFSTHGWYSSAETENLGQWQKLSDAAGAGSISDADLSKDFEQKILPFWIDSEKRLRSDDSNLNGDARSFGLLLANFVHARRIWAQAIVDAARTEDQQKIQDLPRFMTQAMLAQAPVARIETRAQVDGGFRPLVSSQFANWIRYTVGGWDCIVAPTGFEPSPAPSDAKSDGPSLRRVFGCDAQRLFMVGDYRSLDALMNRYVQHLSDLPDGSSHFQGIEDGLDDLFLYGGVNIDQALAHTSDWRKAVPGSLNSELVEALLFSDWAYGARGVGYANTVSAQAEQVFEYRNTMEDAGLKEIAGRASSNPMWYELSLSLGRNQSRPLDELRALYDAGARKFPDYLPLRRHMLNILMPRWFGSYELVDQFIIGNSTFHGPKPDPAMYARLYLMYGNMEGDDFDVVQSARANDALMRTGADALRVKYASSDYILNTAARFYCMDGDWSAYRAIRPLLTNRSSAEAWPFKLSLAQCNQQAAFSR